MPRRKTKWLEIADRNGIPRTTYFYRKRKGWTDEEASTLPPGTKRHAPEDLSSDYIRYKKIAQQKGIDLALFNYLIIDRGYTFPKAIEEGEKRCYQSTPFKSTDVISKVYQTAPLE